ncbi:MAG: DUF1801 domain-containing protein [Planctomycetota bacterium]|nr:DUF1801 domain-containing protein [Planctomycetota bacterium]
MPTKPTTVEAYLASLPEDRREAIEAIREVINANIAPEFEEGIQYGMVGWYLPHERYPLGYHCDPKQPLPFVSVASQKGHIGIYLFCVYLDAAEKERFIEEWKAAGKKLDMGASCVRVKDLEGVALKAVGRVVKRIKPKAFIQAYESCLTPNHRKQRIKQATKLGVAIDENGCTVAPKDAGGSKPATRKASKAKSKAAPKKAATKKAASKKAATREAATRKTATRKTTAKKAASKGSATAKATAKKAVSKKASTRKASPRKAVAKKAASRKKG